MNARTRTIVLSFLLAAVATLGGCYYPPYPGYAYGYGYPGYTYPAPYPAYYGPGPFVGGFVIGGGYYGRRSYR